MSNQILVYRTKEALLEAAQGQASKVDESFANCTKLYFIARYFVAVYESRYGEIPIQVWNEYRNALDHYFRHLTQSDADESRENHLSKMEGHLQRAVLDILKLISHKTIDSVKKERKRHSDRILELVDNGEFLVWLVKSCRDAGKKFETAKVSDIKLGESARTNSDVLDMYLEAAFLYDEIIFVILEREEDISKAKGKYVRASVKSTFHELRNHAIFYVLMTIFVAFIWKPILLPFADQVSSYFTSDSGLDTDSKANH